MKFEIKENFFLFFAKILLWQPMEKKHGNNLNLFDFKILTIILLHYEAKLCILCIVSRILNRPKSDVSRNPQHCYIFLKSSMLFSIPQTNT